MHAPAARSTASTSVAMAPPPSSLSSTAPPFPPHATGDSAARAAGTTFATQAPQLAAEKARATDLFRAYEELRARVAAWSSRLAQEQAPLASPSSASGLNDHAPAPTVEDFAPPSADRRRATSAGANNNWSPPRQAAGEAEDGPRMALRFRASARPSPNTEAATGGEVVTELLASAKLPTSAPSPLRVPPSATSTSSSSLAASSPTQNPLRAAVGRDDAASARANASHKSPTPTNGRTPTPTTTSPTTVRTAPTSVPTAPTNVRTAPTFPATETATATATATVPPWMERELEAFFDDALARAIQARESQLVNVLHACARQELAVRDRRVEALERQQSEFDKCQDHWQSKLDRRVAETNALRKEFYKQLLLLRELVAKQRSDPRTLRALEDVIASVMPGGGGGSGGDGAAAVKAGAAWLYPQAKREGGKGEPAATTATGSAAMRKEKEKWEERAREAAAECQQLQEQVLVLKQQLEEARGLDGELWFATAQHGLYERQRILDSVYRSKCSWEQVGESVLELLNNEMVWAAVEESAFRDKTRVSRGLEALLLGSGSRKGSLLDPQGDSALDGLDELEGAGIQAARASARRRASGSQEGSRVIMCRTCNGCGYLDASAVAQADGVGQEDDSYLRKTLAQVLELKTALDEANTRTNQVEQQLLRTVMEGAQIKETLEKIEFTRAHSVDSGLQTDLDEEEEIDVDAIMNAYSNGSDDGGDESGGGGLKRRGGRWKQYEHLIVELKNLLTERDAAIAQLRAAVADAQARLVNVQKVSQQEQDRLQRELQTLKGSLALAMNNRNDVIEEKQAAVNMLLKTMDRKKSQALSSKSFLLPRPSKAEVNNRDDGAASVDSNNESDDNCDDFGDDDAEIDEEDEVKRSEMIARRYSQAIGRVQQEHQEQQQRLKDVEDELGQETDKRKRTNSIMLGNIAVTMTSHPRDLFKALSSTHQELLNYRRSSQRSSALQTDRLLTLTTHLAHISEELVMVKKRTSAEIEFWKLDCEKMQNANKSLAADFEKAQKLIEEANERTAQVSSRRSVTLCGVCEKHEARLLAISAQLLKGGVEDSLLTRRPSSASNLNASGLLNEVERQGLGAILLDLENLYSTLSVSKQEHAKQAITRALLGGDRFAGSPEFCVNPGYPVHPMQPRSSFRRATSSSSVGGENEGTLLAAEQRISKRNTRMGGPASSARLFQDPSFLSSQGQLPSSGNPFVVQGSALSAAHISEGVGHSHHRKKIVRKVLSEQEALNRQRARSRRNDYTTQGPNVDECGGEQEHLGSDGINTALSGSEDHDDSEPVVSSYVNENGRRVFYVDVEEDEEENGPDNAEEDVTTSAKHVGLSHNQFNSHELPVHENPSRRLDLAIQIPSLDNPTGGQIYDGTRERQLFDQSDDIDKDPEVISKLRELVNQNARARGEIALMNWTIFVSHIQAARDQRRLDFMNDTWRSGLASGKLRAPTGTDTPSLPQSVRTTMQKLVQMREFALDDAIRARDDMRKELRRTQAHLIHSVATVLTNLSRKNKVRAIRSDSLPLVHFDPQNCSSPTHSPSRPLYPSARVNLSEIPKTQQVPTPSFPLSGDPGALNEHTGPRHGNTSPTTVSLGAKKLLGEQVATVEDLYTPSVFENDNRFPQRSVKFVPAGDGDEPSLMHSTSAFHAHSPKHSPTKSPSKAGLSVDTRRRPTHSAGPVLNSPNTYNSTVDPMPHPGIPVSAHFIDPTARRPIRPQSSPAGVHTRFRPSSASLARGDERLATEDTRSPDLSAKRPSSSKTQR